MEFDYKTPRYHNYNVTLQTESARVTRIEVGYVGTRGRNLETFTGMNNVTRLLPPGTNPQQHVTWPNFARGSLLVRTVGVSDYDSLQMKFQRRYHAGLGFLVSYTLSDSTTNAGDSLSGGGVGGLRAPDVAGWSLENDIGQSGFYTKHALVFSGTYDLPGKWRDPRRLARQLGRVDLQRPGADDQLLHYHRRRDGLLCARRRRPVCGQPRREPVLQPGGVCQSRSGRDDRADTTSARSAAPRSQVTGPPLRQLDFGVAKQFRIAGERQFEIRAEAFNLTNTPSFNLPGSLNFRDARNFASITSMRNAPRQFQLGAKVYW